MLKAAQIQTFAYCNFLPYLQDNILQFYRKKKNLNKVHHLSVTELGCTYPQLTGWRFQGQNRILR